MTKNKTLKFPKGFLWGTSTAAHQIEGNNTHSDWWAWEQSGGGEEPSGLACNSYELYKEDFRLAREVLHNNAHRLSIEWARIEPEEGKFDENEIEHYRDVLSELKNNGFKTFVTLFHFTLPHWFAKKGGFEKKENIKYFERYVQKCIGEFQRLINFWIIINEPNVLVGASWLAGIWPPEKRNLVSAVRVFKNLADAHNECYKLIHQNVSDVMVGSAVNVGVHEPTNSKNPLDTLISRVTKFFVNDSFYFLTEKFHDFYGLNYYFHNEISALEVWSISNLSKDRTHQWLDDMKNEFLQAFIPGGSDIGWKIYPKGIYDVSVEIYNKFHKPIYITENGLADSDDSHRIPFLRHHLYWLHRAIQHGADIRGYFHWTLVDNFEWAFGFKPKFGLFAMERGTLRRIKRKSADLYGEICRKNALTLD